MNKLIFVLWLVLCAVQIFAQNIATTTADSSTVVHITIPFEQFIFTAGNGKANYQLSVNLINENKTNVFQKVFDIRLERDNVIEGAALLLDYRVVLKPGNYKMVTLLRNSFLGDKKERQFNISVPVDEKNAVRNLVVADNGKVIFTPVSYKQLNSQLKTCFIEFSTMANIDSVLIVYVINNSKFSQKVQISKSLKYDIMPVILQGNLTNLEVQYYSGNLLEKTGWSLFRPVDSYAGQFSLKDQLQQIRYIANQNEWKALKQYPENKLQDAIDWFWERHNSNPVSTNNEARDIFFQRVLKAEELFTIHKKLRGWKSDRGRIYIKYGQPDDIVDDMFSSDGYPNIHWYYYRENKVFVFVDKTGYGNYKLVEDNYEN
jgi:GWxTD domain-containing protein